MDCLVTIQLGGADVAAGRLFLDVRRGMESASFVYDDGYLADARAFPLGPDLPLVPGSLHVSGGRLFGAFEDCMPDRWGRSLLLRAERRSACEEGRATRSLFERDYLVGVSDETRQGAIRIWDSVSGKPLSSGGAGVPREVSLPSLLSAADAFGRDADADVRDLLVAGSSLGGARPKASIRDEHGCLYIAKFPKPDEGALEDVCAWEYVALRLAARAGIEVPAAKLLRIGDRSVLLSKRFDRTETGRVPYISGLTAIQGIDGGRYSYLELVDFLETDGARPEGDIQELWRRALFGCAIGNTDNHMRNYGLLRANEGWRLAPAFDVNPTMGDGEKYLASGLDFDSYDADPRRAFEVCDYFRLSSRGARIVAAETARALANWRAEARSAGIAPASVALMAGCFEAGIRRLEEVARGAAAF